MIDGVRSETITRFGLGLAALGRPAYITSGRGDDLGERRSVDDLRARTARVLDASYAAGVRYVDAARSYGYAEEFLASWLSGRPDVGDLVIASKWGYRYVGDWRRDADVHEVKDHSRAAFDEQLEATRRLLGDPLAVYQVHSLMPDDSLFDDPETIERLAALRDTGVRVGFSTSGSRQADTVRRALEVEVDGPVFSVVQSTWNLLETSAGPALEEAHRAGLDVVVKEGLANGRLAPGSTSNEPAVAALRLAAAELAVGADAVALAAVLAQPWVTRVLSGVVTVDQLHSNLRAADVELSPGLLARLVAVPERPESYWQQRAQREWL